MTFHGIALYKVIVFVITIYYFSCSYILYEMTITASSIFCICGCIAEIISLYQIFPRCHRGFVQPHSLRQPIGTKV